MAPGWRKPADTMLIFLVQFVSASTAELALKIDLSLSERDKLPTRLTPAMVGSSVSFPRLLVFRYVAHDVGSFPVALRSKDLRLRRCMDSAGRLQLVSGDQLLS